MKFHSSATGNYSVQKPLCTPHNGFRYFPSLPTTVSRVSRVSHMNSARDLFVERTKHGVFVENLFRPRRIKKNTTGIPVRHFHGDNARHPYHKLRHIGYCARKTVKIEPNAKTHKIAFLFCMCSE